MSDDDTSPDDVAVGSTEELDPPPLAWADEPDDSEAPRSRLHIDGRIVPAALATVGIAAVSVAATLALTAPRQPDRFEIRPAPVQQAPPPAPKVAPPSTPKEAAPPIVVAAPPPVAPPAEVPPAQVPPNPQQKLRQALRGDTLQSEGGNGLYSTEAPAAVDSEARAMCQDLANGGSIEPYITGTERKSPSLQPWQAVLVIHQVIQAYCPQLDR